MTELGKNQSGALAPVELDKLPKGALQAIYHAVTGKTESLSRNFDGNVICTTADIDRLQGMIMDQLDMYPKEVTPTTTIVVKTDNDQAITYSSWERFKVLRVDNHEITSDLTIKTEAIFTLPNTPAPQRCVINVVVDSSLPVVAKQREDLQEIEALGIFFMMRPDWRTVVVKIDFVDFLLAKSVIRTVEEWFKSLKPTPKKSLNAFIRSKMNVIQRTVHQLERLGFAAYLAGIAALVTFSSMNQIITAVSVGLFIWSVLAIYSDYFAKFVMRRAQNNIIPAVVLLTDADITAYDKIERDTNRPVVTLLSVFGSIALAIALNIAASYIFRYITS